MVPAGSDLPTFAASTYHGRARNQVFDARGKSRRRCLPGAVRDTVSPTPARLRVHRILGLCLLHSDRQAQSSMSSGPCHAPTSSPRVPWTHAREGFVRVPGRRPARNRAAERQAPGSRRGPLLRAENAVRFRRVPEPAHAAPPPRRLCRWRRSGSFVHSPSSFAPACRSGHGRRTKPHQRPRSGSTRSAAQSRAPTAARRQGPRRPAPSTSSALSITPLFSKLSSTSTSELSWSSTICATRDRGGFRWEREAADARSSPRAVEARRPAAAEASAGAAWPSAPCCAAAEARSLC